MDATLIAAARRGARSIRVRGWMAEECEDAALERLARHPKVSPAASYLAGRAAAIDELRKLTGHRRLVPASTVPEQLDDDLVVPESGYDRVEDDDLVARVADRLGGREGAVVRMHAAGMTGQQIADRLGVNPSVVVVIDRRVRRRLGKVA